MNVRPLSAYESKTIARALRVMERALSDRPVSLTSPDLVRQYLAMRMFGLQYEVFLVLMLDAQNKMIACCEMFRGTVSQTAVYPREIVRAAIAHNASAVVLAHCHPSGMAEPSHADRTLTDHLKQALALVDVAVLDHVIAAGTRTTSFAERGYL